MKSLCLFGGGNTKEGKDKTGENVMETGGKSKYE
jgi:hypothetical protein